MKERKELAEKERKDTEGEKEREAKPEKGVVAQIRELSRSLVI